MAADAARILLIAAATSTTGGGERHVADLLRHLPKRGFEVSLVCPPGGDLTELAESLGIRVENAAVDSAFPVAGVRAVRSAVGHVRPHIVHAHGSRAAFYARVGDASAAKRCVYTLHGIEAGLKDSRFLRARRLGTGRLLRSRTARFICVCEADREKGAQLGLIDPERSVAIHNGIELPDPVEPRDFRGELGVDDRAPLMLSVGKFREQKDHHTLIEAWARVSVRFPTAVLALVGAGPLESKLRDFANDRSVARSLRFVAPRPDLRSAYTDADAFVLSSRWEGLPYVVLEAMAHGLPVISTAVDGIPEAVTDRRTGLLVPPADPRILAEALMWVIAEPEKAARLGGAGRERVAAEFGLDAMVDKVAGVYREVAG